MVTLASVVAEVANIIMVLAVAKLTLVAAALMVLAVEYGYTVTVWPESLRIPTTIPTSVGCSLTPVLAELVVIVLNTADNCNASEAVVPTATKPVAPSPHITVDDSGEFPAASTLDGIAIVKSSLLSVESWLAPSRTKVYHYHILLL